MNADAGRLVRGLGDTIAAPASARGVSARAVLRTSGARALEIARAACERPEAAPPLLAERRRGVARARLRVTPCAATDALLVVLPGPRSYTGEDQVEFHLPGSPALCAAVFDRLLGLGARAADPGEFTRRAFLAGRLDLTQVEAVAALIHARGEAERRSALDLLGGAAGRVLAPISDRLVRALAAFELDLDFSDQDLGWTLPAELDAELGLAGEELARLARAPAARAARAHEPRVVLAGPVNAGKSSLFNALIGRGAAIVSDRAGTTRDALRATCDLGDLRVVLIDTAGEGHVGGAADLEADRAREDERRAADLVLHVRDGRRLGTDPPPDAARLAIATHADRVERAARTPGPLWVSAVTGEGLDALRAALRATLADAASEDVGLAFNGRQRGCLEEAAAAVARARAALAADAGSELAAADLHEALASLRALTGEDHVQGVLDRVMRDFCIGK